MPKKALYFLAIIPEKEVKDELMNLKLELADKFDSKSALKSPPHVTLHMPFQWRTDREGDLKEKLTQFRFEEFPFTVQLKDFDFFDPKVVFVSVETNEELTLLQKQLVKYVRQTFHILNADYKDKPFRPHVTIGFRDLKKSIFPEVRAFYQDRKYKTSFEVGQICLLKHNGKTWDEFFYF